MKTYVNYFLSYSTFDAEIYVILYSLIMIHNWLDALVSKEIMMSYLAFQIFMEKEEKKKCYIMRVSIPINIFSGAITTAAPYYYV